MRIISKIIKIITILWIAGTVLTFMGAAILGDFTEREALSDLLFKYTFISFTALVVFGILTSAVWLIYSTIKSKSNKVKNKLEAIE